MKSEAIPHNIQEALESLGVTASTLTEDEKRALDEDGYLIFQDLADRNWLAEMREVFEKLVTAEGEQAGAEYILESGTRRLANLVNKGEAFDRVYTHPKILAAVLHIIGREFRLDMLNGRDTLPGEGLQKLHADWGPRRVGEPYHAVNSIWLLDDFTEQNGATRLVPGTHRLPGLPDYHLENPLEPHANEMLLIAPAGTVLVYNAHMWHGGTQNRSDLKRRSLHGFYVASEHQRPYQCELDDHTSARITSAANYVLSGR